MVTLNNFNFEYQTYDFIGLATDTKPVKYRDKTITNGTSFFELGTSKVYMFDEENLEWIEV